MTPPVLRVFVTVASLSSLLAGSAVAPKWAAGTATAHLVEAYGKLPLSFEANQGQTDRQVKFLSRGSGYTLYLTQREAVLALRPAPARGKRQGASGSDLVPATPSVLRMQLLGANPAAPMRGLDELPGTVNYFVGRDPTKWQTHVPTFAKVKQAQVYPGVDLVYYGAQRQLEFDFLVTPGTDPTAIRLSFQGADELKVDEQGNLLLRVNGGEVRLATPRVYQEVQGNKQRVAARYIVEESENREPRTANSPPVRVGFQVAAYDQSRPLVIDPTLVYSTYLGGSGFDQGFSIAVDAAGAAYVAGTTLSGNFTAGCTAPCTVLDATPSGNLDVFVTKLDPTGTALLYATYLGGSRFDQGSSIAVDAAGAAYVTGATQSANFPTACTAPCTVLDSSLNGLADGFVTKLDPTGTALLYSTYLGGSGVDQGSSIAVDAAGAAYVTGLTRSANFPTACTAPCTVLDSSLNGLADGFVTKLNATGDALVYSTYLGGSGVDQGSSIAVDAAGAAYVTGIMQSADFTAGCTAPCTVLDATLGASTDAFVTKLNATGEALVYSTYLGGNDSDVGLAIAVDATGAAYVAGTTLSGDFTAGCTAPCIVLDSTHKGQLDAFVTKLDPTGTALLYATYLGGSGFDQGLSIAVDAAGAAYVTGNTQSANFTAGCMAPCTVLDSTLAGMVDAFVAKISHIGVPATLTVTPATATTLVNTQHCVSATVVDALGNPTPGITVQFSVTGSVTTSGTATTDTNGLPTFCYTGPLFPGTDTITAYADTNTNTTQDADEPSDGATNTWVLPPTTPPSVTINQAAGQADPTSTAPITFTAVFSEPVSDFTGSDVTINGTAGGSKTVTVTGGPSTYTVAVNGLTSSGTVIATIPAGGATDAAGNGNTASTSTDNTVTFQAPPPPDTTAPTVTINQAAGQADPTSTAPITFTAVFSEPVSDFTGSDVTINGTAGGSKTVAVTEGPSTYTVAVNGLTTGGTVIATIPAGGATDAAGNGNTASTSTDNTVTLTP
jgi:hypothetical protein